MNASLLPAIHRPPQDPTSLRCNERLGWPLLGPDHVAVERGALTLERSPGSLRWLTEPSGSFGGLRPPANVAVESDAIWLLDAARLTLLRFDPCHCRFEAVPCFGGEGSGPRELRDPGGIAVAANHLFVCDTGNGRLGVFILPTLALSGWWVAPMTWTPTSVVVDNRGTVFVADRQNGMIHRFSPYGSYLGHWDGIGASTHIAIDRQGTVYAAGAFDAFRVGADGRPVPLTAPADDIASMFAPPFGVDAEGRMSLGAACAPPTSLVFDGRGDVVTEESAPAADRYERQGVVTLGPFDSLIDRCTWHRVILRGELPGGCRVGIATTTSEIDLPASELHQLPDRAWETRGECTALPDGEWDVLVRSVPARFLWLRIELSGNGRVTPRLQDLELEFPRISLRRYLPSVFGAEPRSADFTDRFLALFDRQMRDTEHLVDNIASLFDPLSTSQLAWLASWIGIELDRQIPEELQRVLVKRWAETADVRGTRFGLWRLLIVYLGLDLMARSCGCSFAPGTCALPTPTCPPTPPHEWGWDLPPLILEHYQLRRWLEVGIGRLGDQAMLWGRRIVNRSQLGEGAQVSVTQLKATPDPLRDPFHVYAHRFTVFVPASVGKSPGRRRALERLIARESPAHTEAQIEYVEPRFRIGFQSMIGLDSVVGCLPDGGVTLGETPIGPASVLGGSETSDRYVDATRVGTTTILD